MHESTQQLCLDAPVHTGGARTLDRRPRGVGSRSITATHSHPIGHVALYRQQGDLKKKDR